MRHSQRPFLMFVRLCAVALRTVMGAPCCAPLPQIGAMEASLHSGHAQHDHKITERDTDRHSTNVHKAHGVNHSDHGHSNSDHHNHCDDPSANPCCSAYGPTLPPEAMQIAHIAQQSLLPEPDPVRAFATRPLSRHMKREARHS